MQPTTQYGAHSIILQTKAVNLLFRIRYNADMERHPRKAFAYLRVSGKSQIDGDGFIRQLEAVRKYATANSLKVVRVFREEGVSGTKELANRPALQDMMAALYTNGVRLVLIEKLDRLARDLMVQETILAEMRKHGIEVISVAEPDLCSDDPSRKLVRQVFGAIAEYERAMIVLKLRAARQRIRAKRGRCEGRKPFGARDGEGPIIKQMQRLRDSGMALNTVADKLNEDRVPTRTGRRWHAMTVSRILRAQSR